MRVFSFSNFYLFHSLSLFLFIAINLTDNITSYSTYDCVLVAAIREEGE